MNCYTLLASCVVALVAFWLPLALWLAGVF